MPAVTKGWWDYKPKKQRKPNPKTTERLRRKLAVLRARNAGPLKPK